MRLDKLLAHTGYGTRTEVKKLLKSKVVKVDGVIAKDAKQKVDLSKQTNTESIKRRKDIQDPEEFQRMQRQIILNSVNVLMKRGVYGTYIYANDPLLRKALLDNYAKIKH